MYSPGAYNYGAIANSLALQSDGKILVGGNFYYFPNHGRWFYGDFGLLRFNKDGTLDRSLNGSGIKDVELGWDQTNACIKIALQSDGKIIMAGKILAGRFIGIECAIDEDKQQRQPLTLLLGRMEKYFPCLLMSITLVPIAVCLGEFKIVAFHLSSLFN